MRKQHIIIVVCLAVIVVGIGRSCRSGGRDAGLGDTIHEVGGATLAAELSDLLPGGGQVVLVAPGTEAGELPVVESFVAQIEKTKGFEVVGRESFTEEWGGLEGFEPLGAETVDDIVARYPQAVALVSFEGVPSADETGTWPETPAKLLVYTMRVSKDFVLEVMNVVDVAIVPRVGAAALPQKPTKQQIIDSYFEILRAE